MLLVNRLPAHPESVRHLLPRPALRAGVGDLEMLELVEQPAQRRDGAQTYLRILAVRRSCQFGGVTHGRQSRLTELPLSTVVDHRGPDLTILRRGQAPTRTVSEARSEEGMPVSWTGPIRSMASVTESEMRAVPSRPGISPIVASIARAVSMPSGSPIR